MDVSLRQPLNEEAGIDVTPSGIITAPLTAGQQDDPRFGSQVVWAIVSGGRSKRATACTMVRNNIMITQLTV